MFLLALFLVLAVPRIAAHEPARVDRVIHACVNPKSGEIKIMVPLLSKHSGDDSSSGDDDQDCKKNDIHLDLDAREDPRRIK